MRSMYREVPDALQLSVTLACPVQRARHLLSTAEGLLSWFASTADFKPEVGFEYRLEVPQVRVGVVEGRVRGYDPGSGIAYTVSDDWVKRAFGVTVARWAWEPLSGDYSLVTVTHTGHGQGDSWQQAYEQHLRQWVFFLGNLASVVNEGRDRRVDER